MNLLFTADHIERLCHINNFIIKKDRMHFFGLRGCTPIDTDDLGFQKEHQLRLTQIDYTHPLCTIGQWLPQEGRIAVFPASTVPHIRYVKFSRERNGDGANQLMTGYYKDYRKGIHKPGGPTAHPAFRQTEAHPIRRTADDFDFDNDDRVDFVNPYDNIHAAWNMGVNHDVYSSAGCQVIVGYPACAARPHLADIGPWKVFKENAYAIQQESFPYILLNGLDAHRVDAQPGKKISVRLRYGSEGALALEVQRALRDANAGRFYEGKLDGIFGDRMLRAVLEYQTAQFGPQADDGVVGPVTAGALGITWQTV